METIPYTYTLDCQILLIPAIVVSPISLITLPFFSFSPQIVHVNIFFKKIQKIAIFY